ncbi:alpha-amylase [Aeromonas sanarellii]|uniref:Alpha-amylase n=1 Tax=Aeromonas sanarellii TaxID=633415 RepID=A0ABS4B8G8_9GAMM|nr:alpha-amylase [Aeromonas sanarellii]MBP0603021.1 alpha-amylase [Aeromonas sanarellii]
MRSSSRLDLRPSALWLAVLATPLFAGQALAAPEVYLHVDGKPVAEALALDKGTVTLTHSLDKGSHQIRISDAGNSCGTSFGPTEAKPLPFGTAQPMDKCSKGASFNLRVMLAGDYEFTFNPDTPSLKVLRATKKSEFKRQPPTEPCIGWDGGPVTTSLKGVWPDGTRLRDAYSGQEGVVKGGKLTLTPSKESGGLLLLEPVKAAKTEPFSWDQASVYFLLTDRFHNGDPTNDHSFGRQKDGQDEVATWHGGDFKGLTEKLDYIKQLGINAIWITPMVEQVHGFIGGGEQGNFPFYAYHGYWALDFTRIDPNYGDEESLKTLVDEAHKRGMRIILDVVMNHAGYATLADLQDLGLTDLTQNTGKLPTRWNQWRPSGGLNWHGYNQFIDYQSSEWSKWWGPDWVRAGLPGYPQPGTDDVTGSVAGLPDFLTESTKPVGLPPLLAAKKDTRAKALPDATVSDYLIAWHTDWVRRFGIDGFRADTVKHLEPAVWAKLKQAGTDALKEWKAANPTKKLDDLPFYMVGEVWDHGVAKDFWYQNGFDSLINFDYQREFALPQAQCMAGAEPTYAGYASRINQDPEFNVLSYISSHDTKLFFGDYQDVALQRRVASSFMMLPGGIQIYYGDESGRGLAKDGGVFDQSVRSDMNWQELGSGEKAELVKHWQRLGQFRAAHPAIAAGSHKKLSDAPYGFVREKGEDKVVVVFAGRQQ